MKPFLVFACLALAFTVTACGKRADVQPPADYVQPGRSY